MDIRRAADAGAVPRWICEGRLMATGMIKRGSGSAYTRLIRRDRARAQKAKGEEMTKAQEPYLWICIVPGKWEPENIRAWTRDPDRAAQLAADGLDMKPLYLTAQPQTSSDTVPVPKKALEWLFGSEPDADGKWFGECRDAVTAMEAKYPRRYWWRSKFRSMIPALSDTRPNGNSQ